MVVTVESMPQFSKKTCTFPGPFDSPCRSFAVLFMSVWETDLERSSFAGLRFGSCRTATTCKITLCCHNKPTQYSSASGCEQPKAMRSCCTLLVAGPRIPISGETRGSRVVTRPVACCPPQCTVDEALAMTIVLTGF